MTKIEKYMILIFFAISEIMLLTIVSAHVKIPLVIFSSWIHYPFYFMALAVPIYMGLKWLEKRSLSNFILILIIGVPAVVFTTWFIFTMIQLRRVLTHF